MNLDHTDVALGLDLEDPLEAVVTIARRVRAFEIARDAYDLADRLVDARSGVAIVGVRADTRAFVNAWIGRSVVPAELRCEVVITNGLQPRAVVKLGENTHRHVELAALEGYLGSIADTAPAIHVAVPRPLPDDLRLVELPAPRSMTRRDLAEALAYRECSAAILVVSASEGLSRSACRRLKQLESIVDEVELLTLDLDALAKLPRGRAWHDLDRFVRRQSSAERLLEIAEQRECALIGLVDRLQRYLREHRRALLARREVAGRRAHALAGFVDAISDAIDASWPAIQEERDQLASMLEQERTKFLMGDTADLLGALVDRVEAQPVADPDTVTQLTNAFIEDEIARWRGRLVRVVDEAARLLRYKLEHAIRRVAAARLGLLEDSLPSPIVALGISCYRFRALALPPIDTWRNALRPFRGRAALVDEGMRMAVELANQLLARNSRDVIEDLFEMVTLSLQALVATLATSARELAAASKGGVTAAHTLDAIGPPARQSALQMSELLLHRVTTLGRWFTPN